MRKNGFTLTEVVISMAVMAIFSVLIYSFVFYAVNQKQEAKAEYMLFNDFENCFTMYQNCFEKQTGNNRITSFESDLKEYYGNENITSRNFIKNIEANTIIFSVILSNNGKISKIETSDRYSIKIYINNFTNYNGEIVDLKYGKQIYEMTPFVFGGVI